LAGAVILLRGFHARPPEARLALLFLAVNLAAACFALPFIPGNPRYLLFSMAVLPTLLAVALDRSWGRPLFALLVALGAATALAQVRGAWDRDAAWRSFAAALEAGGLTRCTTDFFLATKINFACGERVICSAKLGPTTTEYFPEYRAIVERAPRVALVAVNRTAAGKLERRLLRLGVAFERRELMKPTLVPSRNVDPAELFPDRAFPLR
ncbi:MAG TPA: hypothetical protein VFM29_08200, partial [Vicinamibacteria bacterium]|nr:hypothetical protein [Vicinamibacteria bacterium]